MRLRWLYFFISAVIIVPGIISLLMFGLKPSIDFAGGTLLEIQTVDPNLNRDTLINESKNILPDAEVQELGGNVYQLKGQTIDNATKDQLLTALQKNHGHMTELRFETLGPTIGRELIIKTLIALALAMVIITGYIALQFKQLEFGVSAVLAMVHDSLVILGVFSLLGHFFNVEVDILFVTALLTTLSFSVHDTIVVFDRIRELRRLHPKETLRSVMNAAVVQTLNRSLNNSLTVIIMLLALVVLGGESIKWFSVALLVGAITGTYSSIFTAAPLVYLWEEARPVLKKVKLPAVKRPKLK